MNNWSAANVTDEGHCKSWQDAQHAVFQLANLCMLLAFLTPHNFRYHIFYLRIMVSLCYVLTLVWSLAFVCMLDILVWSGALLLVNAAHLVYLACLIVPPTFTAALEDVFLHSFKPLNVSRKQFKTIADLGTMHLLGKGSFYAKQDQTQTGEQLSILLKGRLRVSYNEIYLHFVDANEFIDSPEFDNRNELSSDILHYKVDIRAMEDCLIVSWAQDRLRKTLSRDHVFRHIFYQLIGKDISHKLYAIQERMLTTSATTNDDVRDHRRSSMVNVRNSIVSSSTHNLTQLNCLQGCMYDQPSNLSSNGTYETSV